MIQKSVHVKYADDVEVKSKIEKPDYQYDSEGRLERPVRDPQKKKSQSFRQAEQISEQLA